MRFLTMMVLALALLVTRDAQAQDAAPGRLGSTLKDLTKKEADALGWDEPRGAKVVTPATGGPADAAGLLPGDILVSLDGMEIANAAWFVAELGKKPAGAEIKLSVRRAAREKRFAVTLGANPEQHAARSREGVPQPILDTGGHLALVNDIAFTPDGRQLVSASDDKTIRIWDVETGKTVRTIRGDIAPGDEGKIYAMALSADGKRLAVGGWLTGEPENRDAIRLYDFASGTLIALLKGHGNSVLGLAFSPDGRHLLSGSADATAILWNVETGQLEHRLMGHGDQIFGVGFTPDSERAVTGSFDHDLRLWRVADGGQIAQMTGHSHKVYSLAVASDGTIASGDWSGEIRLWDGATGAFRKVAAKRTGEIASLSFSPDAKFLLSGVGSSAPYDCHVFDLEQGRDIVTYPAYNSVLATAISPDGRWAATGDEDNGVHIWDLREGYRRQGPDSEPLRLGGGGRGVRSVGFSPDSSRLAWGSTKTEDGSESLNARGPFDYGLALPGDKHAVVLQPQELPEQAADAPPLGMVGFLRAAITHGEWRLSHRAGGPYGYDAYLDIKQGNRLVKTITRDWTDGSGHRAYGFSPDGKMIISGGSSGTLTAYDLDGNKLGDFIGHESDVWAVAPSPDGRFLVSGSDDQTVRLWNLKTRELLITLLQDENGEWVMWAPQSYYAASGPGAAMIGWQIGHGPERETEYITAAQIRKSLNRPDIVSRTIQLGSAEAAVKEAYGTNFKLADLLAKPVPRLKIVSPAANAQIDGGKAEIEIALGDTPDPVKLIRIQVNGRQVAEHIPEQGGGFVSGALKFAVPLAKGNNKIRISAVNETGETSADVTVTHVGNGELDRRGTLYILAIGVDKYPNIPGNDLRFSGADAKAFAAAMQSRAGTLHERVVSRVLVNGASPGDAPTAANVLNALGMLREANDTDTIMVFVAGHGLNEGPNYRFLPTDSALQPGGSLMPATVVPWYAFQEAIEGAKGRRILFLDTCHAGNSYNQRLTNDSYQANVIVYAAARWDQEALERPDLGHGLFTYATVQGVEGQAVKRDSAGAITTLDLRDFLATRVPEMAAELGHAQAPQYFRGRDAEDYVLAP